MILSAEFRKQVREAILTQRKNYSGSDADYAKRLGISSSVYSRLNKGETEQILSDSIWLKIARELDVNTKQTKWKVVKTFVYQEIESNLLFCKQNNQSMMLADDCGIGKTYSAKNIVRGLKDAFYLDCSQAKQKQAFIRELAKRVGVDNTGRFIDVKNNLKYYLNQIENPIVILDEAGDLEYTAFLELKELWNATDGACAWFMMGADGLRNKIERGINGRKVGYAEIFSRFSDSFVKIVPQGKEDKEAFYKQLLGDVANANLTNKAQLHTLVRACLKKGSTLRHLETLIKAER